MEQEERIQEGTNTPEADKINIEIDEDNEKESKSQFFAKVKMDFPCDYPISVTGVNSPEFEAFVKETLSEFVPDIDLSKFTTRQSAQQKYQSMNIRFQAVSKEQLYSIYKALGANKLVKWIL